MIFEWGGGGITVVEGGGTGATAEEVAAAVMAAMAAAPPFVKLTADGADLIDALTKQEIAAEVVATLTADSSYVQLGADAATAAAAADFPPVAPDGWITPAAFAAGFVPYTDVELAEAVRDLAPIAESAAGGLGDGILEVYERIGAAGTGLTALASQASVDALPTAAENLGAWNADAGVDALKATVIKLESMTETGLGVGVSRYTGAALINAPAAEGGGAVTIDLGQALPTVPTPNTVGSSLRKGETTLDAAVSSRATPAQVNAEVDLSLLDVGLTATVTGRLDATVSSRSTYQGLDTAGTTTLVARLTAQRATNLDFLTGPVGGDTPGTTTLLARLSAPRAAALDLLDAAVSTRAIAATALSSATWTPQKAGFLDAAISSVQTGGVSAAAIAAAVLADPAMAAMTEDAAYAAASAVRVDTLLESDPGTAGFYRYTDDALANAPAPTGGGGGGEGATIEEVRAALADGSGRVALTATGLDLIPMTAPSGPATTFRGAVVQTWRKLFKKGRKTATEVVTFGDDEATVLTTQPVTRDEFSETQGAAT